ncbi:MAG: GNAT family N-acetyltransferase [Anaerolineae bacterium]
MQATVQYLTAETAAGRDAIATVMEHSYRDDVDMVPPEWALVRQVDGVPVAFILLDPGKSMEFPRGDLPFAFICGVATREDQRGQGHFRAIMAEGFRRLRRAGLAAVVTHGPWALYEPFDFARFTHHSGIFASVALLRRELGSEPYDGPDMLVQMSRGVLPDLLVVTESRASTVPECLMALRQAADTAERAGRSRVLFEEPAAPSYGRSYPLHHSLRTQLVEVACGLGAEHRVMGDDPAGGAVAHADGLKVLSTAGLLRQVLSLLEPAPLPEAAVAFTGDAGSATLLSDGASLSVADGTTAGATIVSWPTSALAQLVTGYRAASLLDALYGTSLPQPALELLDAAFPRRWRLTRNESWTYEK